MKLHPRSPSDIPDGTGCETIGTSSDNREDAGRTSRVHLAAMGALVVAAAITMGAPTLRGTFVGGDDHRLVLDHVLVNHPSWEHALKLFTIVHRDLYQPLPLLSFSAEFAVAERFHLFRSGVDRGAWLFHLTNVVLHAVNALLVFAVIRRLHPPADRPSHNIIALIAAAAFATHPLQVEVVAWINGRMMLLSTLFALASLGALCRWLRSQRTRWAIAAVLFVLCCAISKIRIGLPLLLVMVPLVQRRKLTRGFWLFWSVCVTITTVFVVVNFQATAEAGMFSGAAQNLQGSRIARSLLSLGWYFEHYVWPTGLASWYPAPGFVRWSDVTTLKALLLVAPVLAIAVWATLRRPTTAYGFGWFFVTIASTLQLVPTRNTLAADRYMYLPIIGLLWVTAVGLTTLGKGLSAVWRPVVRRTFAGAAGATVVLAMIATSWHVASFYERPVRKSGRIAQLFPHALHVWERAAWAYYRDERYEDAIAAARRELRHDDPKARCQAYQAIGASLVKLGKNEQAVSMLNKAISENPDSAAASYRLAAAYEEMDRRPEALPLLEQAVARAPLKNPWIIRLAGMYRRLGRPSDARKMYRQALRNNPYEVPATLGLAELDIQQSTQESYRSAGDRLQQLLEWMPENTAARIDLGVIQHAMGQDQRAMHSYAMALQYDPSSVTAAMNLGQIHEHAGDPKRAWSLYERAVSAGLESIEQAVVIHNFLIEQQAADKAVRMWVQFLSRDPSSPTASAYFSLSLALTGRINEAKQRLRNDESALSDPIATVTLTYLDLIDGKGESAARRMDKLCESGGEGAEARRQMLRALATLVQRAPDNPSPFCLAARLLLVDGDTGKAGVFLNLCEKRCTDPHCRTQIAFLRRQLTPVHPASPKPKPTSATPP